MRAGLDAVSLFFFTKLSRLFFGHRARAGVDFRGIVHGALPVGGAFLSRDQAPPAVDIAPVGAPAGWKMRRLSGASKASMNRGYGGK